MVGGDRRSPPRHRAKGGGGRGKGGCGNGELTSGGETSGKSNFIKSSTREEFFRFGEGSTPLVSADGKISARVETHTVVESSDLHKDSSGLYVNLGELNPVQNLLQESEGLLRSGDEASTQSLVAVSDCNLQSNESPCVKVGLATSVGGTGFNGAKSWAFEVEAQEEINLKESNNRGVASLVAGFEAGHMPKIDEVKSYVNSSFMNRHSAGIHDGSSSMAPQLQQGNDLLKKMGCCMDQGMNPNYDKSELHSKLECSKLQRGEDLLLNEEGNLELLQNATSNAQVRTLNSQTANMDCGGMQPSLDVSMNDVNCDVSDWMNKKSGENGGANSNDLHRNPMCTQGIRSMASTEQRAENAYVNSRFLGKTTSTTNSSSLPNMAAANSLGHDPMRGSLGNSNTTFPKPNAWKRIGYHKINLQELGTITENGKSVCFDENAYERNKGRLDKGLVGKLIGRKLPLHILDQELSKRWSHVGGFRTILVGGDCFLCIFETMEARDNILMGGPWLIMGHLIGMDRWSPDFDPRSLSGLTSPVWVRLPKLPLLYWDNITIGRIAAMIGEPLWIDAQTTEWGRSEYARVCVRLDLSKSLPTGVWIQGKNAEFFQPVEYEGISLLCFHCGVVGHKAEVCCHKAMGNPSKTSPGLQETTPMKEHQKDRNSVHEVGGSSSTAQTMKQLNADNIDACDSTVYADPDERSRYGPWILVTRKRKTLPRQRPLATKTQPPSGQMLHKDKKDATVSPPLSKPVTREPVREPMAIVSSDVVPSSLEAFHMEGMMVDSVVVDHVSKDLVVSTAIVTSQTNVGSTPHYDTTTCVENLEPPISHQPHSRSGKERISKAHFEKELLQLGPIALKSRKRKKKVNTGAAELCLDDFNHASDSGGGDASPSRGK